MSPHNERAGIQMVGHTPFRELQARRGPLTPERLAMQQAYRQALQDAEWLHALREGSMSPEEVDDARRASQARISQATPRADLYLAALAGAVEALGGRLVLTAAFPDQSVDLAIPASVADDESADVPEVISAAH